MTIDVAPDNLRKIIRVLLYIAAQVRTLSKGYKEELTYQLAYLLCITRMSLPSSFLRWKRSDLWIPLTQKEN